MQERERKRWERWERVRKKGMWAYVLVNGIGFYGGMMFVIMTFVFKFQKLPLWETALLWLSSGAAYGIGTWLALEHGYRKATAKNETT